MGLKNRNRTNSRCFRMDNMMAELSEMDDDFSALRNPSNGLMTVAGFGSLLSMRSAKATFPDLKNFRAGRLRWGMKPFCDKDAHPSYSISTIRTFTGL